MNQATKPRQDGQQNLDQHDAQNEPTMDDILASIKRIISQDDDATAQSSTQATSAATSTNQPQQAAQAVQAKPAPSKAMIIDDDDDDDEDDDEEVMVLGQPAHKEATSSNNKSTEAKTPSAQQQNANKDNVDTPRTNADMAAKPSTSPKQSSNVNRGNQKMGRDDSYQNRLGQALSAAQINAAQKGNSSGYVNGRDGDMSLISDERILSATTESLGTASFASLERAVRMGKAGDTLEDIVRNLLRPMLRGWIDQNLPSLVERMVQAEIQKIVSGARRQWNEDDE